MVGIKAKVTSVSVTWLGIRTPHTEEKQLRGGKEPGLHCTELEISLRLALQPQKRNSGGFPHRVVFGYVSVITPQLMNSYGKSVPFFCLPL